MSGFDWQQALGTALTTGVPIALYMWANRRKAKHEIEKKHEENLQIFNKIQKDMEFFPLHEHLERSGPLSAEGIRKRC